MRSSRESKMRAVVLLYLMRFGTSCFGFSPIQHEQYARFSQERNFHGYHPMSSTDGEDAEALERRMEIVRSLQRSFYASTDEKMIPALDTHTGVLSNLPLWRVQWYELPGRSNVLNVHEGAYTNMFETILNTPKPWYVGHLFLPGGSENLNSNRYCYQLKTWKQEAVDEGRKETRPRTAVLGTLLHIVDYRRLTDGRLLLLVHALERFVVDRVVQSLPYSMADVQILPDEEELAHVMSRNSEATSRRIRAKAVELSFAYHDYEYDSSVRLPVAKGDYVCVDDVFWPDLGKVMPFVPYAKKPRALEDLSDGVDDGSDIDSDEEAETGGASLETRLLESNIMRVPPSHPELTTKRVDMSVAELEEELWQAMEDFFSSFRQVLPFELLCLLPPGRSWPQALKPAGSDKKSIALSPNYPALRRQRRLSFAAPAFLEQTSVGAGLRQLWLETPDTKSRLAAVLERYEMIMAML